MNIKSSPKPFASAVEPLLYTLEALDPDTVTIVEIVNADNGSTLGSVRLKGLATRSIDVAPYLRRHFALTPTTNSATYAISYPFSIINCYIRCGEVQSEVLPAVLAAPHNAPLATDTLLSDMPLQRSLAAGENDEATRHGYLAGDGAVTRYNQQHDDYFGEWVGEVPSKLADEGERDARSQLFAPTINATEIFALAPSVSLPQVGDRDADDPAQLNFPTKILIYHGICSLPDDERWGLTVAQYPLAAFHDAGRGTLCFEDRDGEQGLPRYYDAHYEELREARRVTLSLALSAVDLLPIFATDPNRADLRSAFRLSIGGEEGLYRLNAVEEFDPEEGVARCRFTQLV